MITSRVEVITPEIAAHMLAQNHKNRSLRKSKVDAYRRDMREGRWMTNGEPIIISRSGALVDGQHRLRAVVLSGVWIESVVTRGVDDDTMVTIDTGVARTSGDVLGMSGVSNANHVAATARFLMLLKGGGNNYLQFTNTEVAEFVLERPVIEQSVVHIRSHRQITKLLPCRVVTSWYIIAAHIANNRAEEDTAVDVLKTGIPTYEGDAIHNFRELVISKDAFISASTGVALSTFHTLAGAWVNFISKKKVYRTRFKTAPVKMLGVDYASI